MSRDLAKLVTYNLAHFSSMLVVLLWRRIINNSKENQIKSGRLCRNATCKNVSNSAVHAGLCGRGGRKKENDTNICSILTFIIETIGV